MSENTVRSVEKDLDDLSIRILQLMNDNINCKMNIERTVRAGCLDLAKTRYILGSTNSVSTMKIPTENLSATTTVVSGVTGDEQVFELKRVTHQPSVGNTSKPKNQDPLKWFGILVPANLRQGQSWFVKAIDYGVQSATVTAQLNLSMERYNALMHTKNNLKNQKE